MEHCAGIETVASTNLVDEITGGNGQIATAYVGSRAFGQTLRAPVDGRQSENALRIARGVRRLFRAAGYVTIAEMPLTSGRRADLVALGPDGALAIVEVKSSLADFRADRKWPDYRAHCDRLYFAIDSATPREVIPADVGLILADAFGAEILREAPEHRLAPATRKSMLLRFARLAADRLHALGDPEAVGPIRGR